MKTFSDLQDNLASSDIRVELICFSASVMAPNQFTVTINNSFMAQGSSMISDLDYASWISLSSPICIEINMLEISPGDAFYVKELKIDSIPVNVEHPTCVRFMTVTGINYGTSRIREKGIWQFMITEPFYQWHHSETGQGWLLTP